MFSLPRFRVCLGVERRAAVTSRFWRTETGFFLGIWLFFMAVGKSRLFRDPGTFWHVAAGRRIFSTGQFIRTDSFSFTFAGKPWVAYEWLAECLMAVVDGLGGLDMLLVATATLLALIYTWVAHRLLRSGLHWLPTLLVTAVTVAASANHLHVRPHISTIGFLGLTFGWLCDFEARSHLSRPPLLAHPHLLGVVQYARGCVGRLGHDSARDRGLVLVPAVRARIRRSRGFSRSSCCSS